jgi:hypothetical protein
MQQLNFPAYDFRITDRDGKASIFDFVRKKYLVLTPEEWVRQHAMRFLAETGHVPQNLMVVEKAFKVGRITKRFDGAVFDRQGRLLMLVECKAPNVLINQKAIDQAFRYNLALKAGYLFITNGLKHFMLKIDYENHQYEYLEGLPDYETMLQSHCK